MTPNDVDTNEYQWKITNFFNDMPDRAPTKRWLYELVQFWKKTFPATWEPLTLAGLVREEFHFTRYGKTSVVQILEQLVWAKWLDIVGDGAFVPSAKLLEYIEKFHNTASPTWKDERTARTRRWEDSDRKGRQAQREERDRKEKLGF